MAAIHRLTATSNNNSGRHASIRPLPRSRATTRCAVHKPRGRRDNLGLEELRVLQTKPASTDAAADDEDDVLVLDLEFDDDQDGEVFEEDIFDIQRGWDLDALSEEVRVAYPLVCDCVSKCEQMCIVRVLCMLSTSVQQPVPCTYICHVHLNPRASM